MVGLSAPPTRPPVLGIVFTSSHPSKPQVPRLSGLCSLGAYFVQIKMNKLSLLYFLTPKFRIFVASRPGPPHSHAPQLSNTCQAHRSAKNDHSPASHGPKTKILSEESSLPVRERVQPAGKGTLRLRHRTGKLWSPGSALGQPCHRIECSGPRGNTDTRQDSRPHPKSRASHPTLRRPASPAPNVPPLIDSARPSSVHPMPTLW